MCITFEYQFDKLLVQSLTITYPSPVLARTLNTGPQPLLSHVQQSDIAELHLLQQNKRSKLFRNSNYHQIAFSELYVCPLLTSKKNCYPPKYILIHFGIFLSHKQLFFFYTFNFNQHFFPNFQVNSFPPTYGPIFKSLVRRGQFFLQI